MISLSLSYSDTQDFVTFCDSLIAENYSTVGQNKIKEAIKSTLQDHLRDRMNDKAVISEILTAAHKFRMKLFNWPVHKRGKKVRQISITYMQGFIFWSHYEINKHPVTINDKISLIVQYLTF